MDATLAQSLHLIPPFLTLEGSIFSTYTRSLKTTKLIVGRTL
jgi:hypothetical protein